MTTTAIANDDDGHFHFAEYRGIRIGFRRGDRYVDATMLCQAAGKRWNDYFGEANQPTAVFLRGLSNSTGIPVLKSPAGPGLIEIGHGRGRHTWVHPRVAWHLGQWADPGGLAVFVTHVMDRLEQGLLPTSSADQRALAAPYATQADIAELRLVVDNNAREHRSALEALGWRVADVGEQTADAMRRLSTEHEAFLATRLDRVDDKVDRLERDVIQIASDSEETLTRERNRDQRDAERLALATRTGARRPSRGARERTREYAKALQLGLPLVFP